MKVLYDPIFEMGAKFDSKFTQEQLELALKMPYSMIKKLKRSKEPVRTGDVFVCSLNGKVYYYGKVLAADVETRDYTNQGSKEGFNVVFIFKNKTDKKTLDDFNPDYNNLMFGCGPCLVHSEHWSRGIFENVGNVPLTRFEKKLDYGFFSHDDYATRPPYKGAIMNLDRSSIDHIPKFLGFYAYKTDWGLHYNIYRETILDPSLLEI